MIGSEFTQSDLAGEAESHLGFRWLIITALVGQCQLWYKAKPEVGGVLSVVYLQGTGPTEVDTNRECDTIFDFDIKTIWDTTLIIAAGYPARPTPLQLVEVTNQLD